jgi:hypothetical protein
MKPGNQPHTAMVPIPAGQMILADEETLFYSLFV